MTRAAGQESKLELPGEAQEMAKYAAIKDIVPVDVTELDHHKLIAKLFGMILNYQPKNTSFNRVCCVCVCVCAVCVYVVCVCVCVCVCGKIP